jgi:hypothetical protein
MCAASLPDETGVDHEVRMVRNLLVRIPINHDMVGRIASGRVFNRKDEFTYQLHVAFHARLLAV